VVDRETLDGLLANLQSYTAVLRGLAAVRRDEFLANADKIGNAKYHFVIAIECAIDIANHVIASEAFRLPKDNADSFGVLVDEGVLPASSRERLAAMARFRNRLVHLYADVGAERVHRYLQESLGDLDSFARAIAGHAWRT
jgi:uncharacterized protein YutE (UPF0331/DUF86 family)